MKKSHTAMSKTLADFITQNPIKVMVAAILFAGWTTFFIPQIKSDTDPSKLITSFQGKDDSHEQFLYEKFGRTDNVIFLLLESEQLFSPNNLSFIESLSSHFEKAPWTLHVDSISHTPIAHRIQKKEEAFDLDEISETDLIDEGSDFSQQNVLLLENIRILVDQNPTLFPGGYDSTLESLSENPIEYSTLLKGKEITSQLASQTKGIIEQSPLLFRKLISEDLTVATVALWLTDEALNFQKSTEVTEQIEQYLKNQPPPNNLKVSISGLPFMNVVVSRTMLNDQIVLMPITLLIALFFLYLSFRWIPAVIFPLLTVILTSITFVGGLGLFDEQINILTNILPPMLIIIGLSDSIHLISRYREEKQNGHDHKSAVTHSLNSMLVACLLTSVTTAIGMASLLAAKTALLNRFGVTAGLGVMLAYVFTVTFLPAAMMKLKNKRDLPQQKTPKSDWIDRAVSTLTTSVILNPKKTILFSALFFAACIYSATQIRIDHRILEIFKTTDPFYKSTMILEEKFEGIRSFEIIFQHTLEDGKVLQPDVLKAINNINDWALNQPEVINTNWFEPIVRETLFGISQSPKARQSSMINQKTLQSLLTITKAEDPKILNRFLTADEKATRLQIRLKDVGSKATLAWEKKLREVVQKETQFLKNKKTFFTGDAYIQSKGTQFVIHDLLASLFAAVVIIFLLLSLIFRSFKLGLISIPPNLIPLVGTMAYMSIRSIALNTATVIIFSISIGLAVDGTIHMLARFNEEMRKTQKQDVTHALIKAARGTGKAIVISCLTLVVGFCVLTASSFVPIQRFGELIAVTTLSCLLGTLIIQPALLRLFASKSPIKN